ncbi:MAG TPA: ankyrin repeat domain-containing protein [Gemmatimonadaceae bacterium]
MSEQTSGSASTPLSLPDAPNLDWLRKQAKRQLSELKKSNPQAKLAQAQFDLAKQYGFPSWRALKDHVDSLTVDGQLFNAARNGDVERLSELLDRYPDKLIVGEKPYGWSLLHAAAHKGQLGAVDLLLRRGADVNTREQGDNTYAMHWAAAAGSVDVVRRLADAGGDVVGHGDDHELDVIGWASCWDGCDDDAHHAVVRFLISRGAHHHIFSAIAMNLGDEIRRIVAADSSALSRRMSRNENHQLPLHFAVRMNRPEMVSLLLDLGADPTATDGAGVPATVYAANPNVDKTVIQALVRDRKPDLFSALVLGDEATASRVLEENPGIGGGALHMLAKRGDLRGVKWMLDHGADPSARWSHWGAEVTPLHLAAMHGHVDVARMLLDAGADPTIRDSMHNSDAFGWAVFFRRQEIVQMLESRKS